MEGRRDDMEVGCLEPPGCCQKLFSGRDDRLLRLGAIWPPGRHRVCGPYRCWCARC